MNSATTYKTSTIDSAATKSLGQTIGRLLKGGEVIELVGDVGAGKTTFVQGLAAGMGYRGEVPSPTFTISRTYTADRDLVLYHFDFYRLSGHDIVTDELDEVMRDPRAVTAIEWAGNGDANLPERRLRITITPGKAEDERMIVIESLAHAIDYIVKGLAK